MPPPNGDRDSPGTPAEPQFSSVDPAQSTNSTNTISPFETTATTITSSTSTVASLSSTSDSSIPVLALTSQSLATESATTIPGRTLEVLPIGLGVFGGLTLVVLLVVLGVTIQRMRLRREFRRKIALEKVSPYMVQLPTTASDSDFDSDAPSTKQIPNASSPRGKDEQIGHTSLISDSSRSSLSYWPSDSSWPSDAESEAACTDRQSLVTTRARNDSRFSDDSDSESILKSPQPSPTMNPKSILAYSRNRIIRFGEVSRIG